MITSITAVISVCIAAADAVGKRVVVVRAKSFVPAAIPGHVEVSLKLTYYKRRTGDQHSIGPVGVQGLGNN
jgi:hypothetical protein